MFRYHLFMLFTNLWARTCYRLRVEGKENVPRTGRCVIVANHAGKMLVDLVLFPALWPRRRPVLVMYWQPKAGRAPRTMVWGASVFPVIIAGQRGRGTALKATREILRALDGEEAVFMMLEGEVSWHGRLNPPRPAPAWVALRSGALVVPCAILGTYDAWPRWQEKFHRTGKITVRIGQPFTLTDSPPQRITPEMLERAGERITNEIRCLLEMGH